jgi:hypothetical protein
MSDPNESSPDRPRAYFYMRKDSYAHATSDLEGTWAISLFGDEADGYFSAFGSMICHDDGKCIMELRAVQDGETIFTYYLNESFSVAADGTFGSSVDPAAPAYAGALGNNGNTIIFNDSFGANSDQRLIGVGVKADQTFNLATHPVPLIKIDFNSPYDNSINHAVHYPWNGFTRILKNNTNDSWTPGMSVNDNKIVFTEGIDDRPYTINLFDGPTDAFTRITTAKARRATAIYHDETEGVRKILFIDSADSRLKKMNLDGSAITELKAPATGQYVTFWQGPDPARIILAEEWDDGSPKIRLVYLELDTLSSTDLFTEIGFWDQVSWRGDAGQVFVYREDNSNTPKYELIDIPSGSRTDLTGTDLDNPAGNALVYTPSDYLLSLTEKKVY